MAKLFFLFSGEHETLPVSELTAILAAKGYAYKILENLDQALRLEICSNCAEAVRQRAALTRFCGLELYSCKADVQEALRCLQSANLDGILTESESFAVRVKRVKRYASGIDGMTLERKLGKIILKRTRQTKVKLENPDKTFTGILTGERFVFGMKLTEISSKPFVERRPKRKPFFHPSAMQAKLARCMVNLARPKDGELVFDPFSGTGSMLVEAALIGCRVLGSDIKRKMARGTLANMVYFGIEPEGILVSDARTLPVKEVGCIVTDPPYGRSATTLKRSAKRVVEEVLLSAHDLLRKGTRICIAAPKTLKIRCIGTDLAYKHLESHFVYFHRSLTREIAVFEKV